MLSCYSYELAKGRGEVSSKKAETQSQNELRKKCGAAQERTDEVRSGGSQGTARRPRFG